jgi:hypothetical protein
VKVKVWVEQKIASGQYANNSLIIVIEIVIEDDAPDSGDHVDAHRSICISRRTVREAKGGGLHFVQNFDPWSERTRTWLECSNCISVS